MTKLTLFIIQYCNTVKEDKEGRNREDKNKDKDIQKGCNKR